LADLGRLGKVSLRHVVVFPPERRRATGPARLRRSLIA
jgi:hypothetical protein